MINELETVIDNIIAEDEDARRTFNALKPRIGESEARAELARALTGCLWEQSRGMPDRFRQVLKKMRAGRSAAELFPDSLYSDGPSP